MSQKTQRALYTRPTIRAAIVECQVPKNVEDDVEEFVSRYTDDEIFEKLEEEEDTFKKAVANISKQLGDARFKQLFDHQIQRVEIVNWSWKVALKLARSTTFYRYFGLAPGEVPEVKEFRRLVSVSVKQQMLCDVSNSNDSDCIYQIFRDQIDRVRIRDREKTYPELLMGFFRFAGSDNEVCGGFPIGAYNMSVADDASRAFVVVGMSPMPLELVLYQASLYGISFPMNGDACRSPIPVAAVSFPDGRFEAGTLTFQLQADGGIREMPQLEIIRRPAGDRPGWNIFEANEAKQLLMFLGKNISVF